MLIKKLLARFILVALVLTTLIMPGFEAAAEVASFSDVTEIHTNFQAIDYLRTEGVVVGYSDGSFGDNRNINRAEFLKIVMEASDYKSAGSNCYPDVKDEWFAPYICKATELGFVSGYSDGSFRPAQEINFAEASKIINNILEISDVNAVDFSAWFEGYVRALDEVDAIPAYINSFDRKVTRADMAEMIWRIDTETTYKVSNTYENIAAGVTVQELGGELENFEACSELASYFENNTGDYYDFDDFSRTESGEESMDAPAAVDEGDGSGLGGGSGAGADDYSSTNVQVEGVDEADIVKNDGKYIYLLKDDTVRIVEAYPPGTMRELDEVSFDDPDFYPSDMYVDGDRLVVIGWSYDSLYDYPGGDVQDSFIGYFDSLTKVYIFDIADRSNVDLMRSLSFEGNYASSRKVDDVVYLVANQYNYYRPWESTWTEEDLVPLYYDSENGKVQVSVGCGDIDFVPGVINTTDYLIIAAIPVDEADAEIEQEVIIGSSGNVYASRDNLYIAQPQYSWWDGSGADEKTFVHKFALNETDLDYQGVGTVPGTTLNQFSMDEHEGNLRIATTLNAWPNPATNNVYVLNSGLNLIGKVEGLAPGESIFSTRFVGDRLYMVTFEQIDPLFVIDMSDPRNPSVLGELKIPGVSDYLHPLDENHIIGFGLETASADVIEESGFSWFQGIKISMFDVSDVKNPVELHKVVIGDRGSYSELTYNHKALLFDKEKGIMAFPITVAEIPASIKADSDLSESSWIYGEYTFNGAYVYDVSVDDGFDLRGTVSHYEEDELGDDFEYHFYYGDDKAIDRILYIGDYFYTTSATKVQANSMSSLNEVADVTLAP